MTSGPHTPRVAVPELLARAAEREEMWPADARAGAVYQRIVVDGERYFVKQLSRGSDWIMRVTGDSVHRPYVVWQAGIMDRSPAEIDHTVVGMHVESSDGDPVLTMVMRDVAALLVEPGDIPVSGGQHAGFMDGLAALSAAWWGWHDDLGLTTMAQRVRFFAPDNIAGELQRERVPAPLSAAAAGWPTLSRRAPELWRIATLVHEDPGVVTARMHQTPTTFLHGDWKMGNLGSHRDGRTILLDWAYPGAGPACWDLCWYLALNRARLPESKQDSIDRFRRALERRAVVTDGWWQEQLDLCTIGIMATFGWEKALGDDAELSWWEHRVVTAARRHGIRAARAR